MSEKLLKAFKLTDEEHSAAFERFANAFLVDDYPEIQALGGKKDGGMDAYIYKDSTEKIVLVAQSCISPSATARTKILNTIKKLRTNMPEVLIYCTSSIIGTLLDETKSELRRDYHVTLEICDATWFTQRHKTSLNRSSLSDAYSREILEPFIRGLDPNQLYSIVLSESEERVAIQYLEAVNYDRSKNSNLTKGIFDALITCVTRDSNPPERAYSEEAIVAAICAMFPEGHGARIREIVPGRIINLVSNRALHFNTKADGYILSKIYRDKVNGNIIQAQEYELAFLAALTSAIRTTAEEREIDYTFPLEAIAGIGHKCVLWYMKVEGKVTADPSSGRLNILNAEKLVGTFLKAHPLSEVEMRNGLNNENVLDLLPHSLYTTLTSADEEVSRYLRSKADLFIIHSFLQITPDVQKACQKILTGDVLYLDTTILIRCIGEYYSPSERRPLLKTLESARKLGYQLRTWQPYLSELVSHIKGPVLLEWVNHFRGESKDKIEEMLRTAPTLINVFYRWIEAHGGVVENIISEIIGKSNHVENASEFLMEEFGIKSFEYPPVDLKDQPEQQQILKTWFEEKIKHKTMQEEKFELLVRNDVNSYYSLLTLRRKTKSSGPNYGQKYWYLTLDRMPSRIAKILSPEKDALYEVTMSLSYLMNSVATLANIGVASIPNEVLPATAILDEAEMVSSELREVYQSEWKPSEKKYLRERRLRELVHQLKTTEGESLDSLIYTSKIDILPDELI